MKTIKYISASLLAFVLMSSCDSDLEKTIYDESKATAVVLAKPAVSDLVLNYKQEAEEALSLSWKKSDMGYSAEVENVVELSFKEDNFKKKVELYRTKAESKLSLTHKDLNNKLLKMLEDANKELGKYDFLIRVSSSISSAASVLYSNVVSLSITPYSSEREYPKVWVIGDYCGWNHANSSYLFSFEENDTYQGVINFEDKAVKGFKITGQGDWNNGDAIFGLGKDAESPDAETEELQLEAGGDTKNIECYSNKYYHLVFDKATKKFTYTLSFGKMGIIGSGVGGWGDADEKEMMFDKAKQRFFLDVTLVEGEIKFRLDGSWTTNFGLKDGKLEKGGSDNIKVTAGNYRVYFNLNNSKDLVYELNTKDYGK
ncbi:MAG: SusE domain-containing protein [Bacteroides sp.]|nr:SusE domain-containing protein [Bacteroides sp.]